MYKQKITVGLLILPLGKNKKVTAKSHTNASAPSFSHFENNLGNYHAKDFENRYYEVPKLFSRNPLVEAPNHGQQPPSRVIKC